MKSDFSRFLHYMLSYSDVNPQSATISSPSGLTRWSRSNQVANLFHLDIRVKPEYDNFCAGRSMVEMLGVLAIIGVLSVGAIAGYGKAMMKYKLNQHAAAVNMLINNMLQIKEQLPIAPNTQICYGTLFKKMNLLPDGIKYYTDCDVRDMWFNNNIILYYNNSRHKDGVNNNFGGIGFGLSGSSEGEDICRNILFAAKENADNLWVAEMIEQADDGQRLNVGRWLYGNKYCKSGVKCLHNMTVNDTEVLCNACTQRTCFVYVLYE